MNPSLLYIVCLAIGVISPTVPSLHSVSKRVNGHTHRVETGMHVTPQTSGVYDGLKAGVKSRHPGDPAMQRQVLDREIAAYKNGPHWTAHSTPASAVIEEHHNYASQIAARAAQNNAQPTQPFEDVDDDVEFEDGEDEAEFEDGEKEEIEFEDAEEEIDFEDGSEFEEEYSVQDQEYLHRAPSYQASASQKFKSAAKKVGMAPPLKTTLGMNSHPADRVAYAGIKAAVPAGVTGPARETHIREGVAAHKAGMLAHAHANVAGSADTLAAAGIRRDVRPDGGGITLHLTPQEEAFK